MRAHLRLVVFPVAALLVAAATLGLFVAGVPLLGYVLAVVGAGALGVTAQNRWQVTSGLAWTVAVLFGLALIFPGAWLGQDIALTARATAYQGVVMGITHTPSVHTTTDTADVRLDNGHASVRLHDTDGLYVGAHVEVLVDSAGAVEPSRADDLHTVRDAILAGLGVVIAVLALAWWPRRVSSVGESATR